MQKHVSNLKGSPDQTENEVEDARRNLRKHIAKLVALPQRDALTFAVGASLTLELYENAKDIMNNMDHLQVFKSWLDLSEVLEDIVASAALVFGILARSGNVQ